MSSVNTLHDVLASGAGHLSGGTVNLKDTTGLAKTLGTHVVEPATVKAQDRFVQDLDFVLNNMRTMLILKNRKYGDSALNPSRVFSKCSAKEQLLVRMDDKISRIQSSQADEDEDVFKDLFGYLAIYLIAEMREQSK